MGFLCPVKGLSFNYIITLKLETVDNKDGLFQFLLLLFFDCFLKIKQLVAGQYYFIYEKKTNKQKTVSIVLDQVSNDNNYPMRG